MAQPQSVRPALPIAPLTYDHPANPGKWHTEGLPIGNGRLGAMLFGGVKAERIQFNENTLWGGANNWDGGYDTSDKGFGGYRNFGDVLIDWQGAPAQVPTDYKMSLDLATGIHRVAFTDAKGAKVSREAFASRPDQVMVFRYTADKQGAFSGKIRLKPGQGGAKVIAEAKGIAFEGAMANGLNYAAHLCVETEGGKVSAQGDTVVFSDCDTLTLLLAAHTNYKPDYASGWRTRGDSLADAAVEIGRAAANAYADLRAAHIADFTKLMSACQVDLGQSPPEVQKLTTLERLRRYTDSGNFTKPAADPQLEAQLFQMGRYLLVSSSRPGGLPANLQGLWNASNNPDWASDYHNNINVQMNYWPAEATGLGECAEPLMDFIVNQAPACRVATRRAFGAKVRGWTARTSQSPLGGNGWDWNIPASAWYALHVYDHWDFSRDEEFLRETAHPVLKEICQYWEDRLKKLPDGTLVAPDGWSPEHGPREDGVMHDQQLIWELFDDYLKVAAALGVDADYRAKIADMQMKLAPNKIGKWGQLQEWQADRDDPGNHHRHTSHLFALYPGRQISKTGTPALAQAAKVSLLARSNDTSDKTGKAWSPADMTGDSNFSWVWPWRAAMWARLGEGDRAHALVRGKAGNTGPNGLSLYIPYFRHRNELIQLDGSFGFTAAVAEMLLQSHAGEIHLLPALPKAWVAQGSFRGLCARGGFSVDCAWKEGAVVSATVSGKPGAKAVVRIGGRKVPVKMPASGRVELGADLRVK